MKRYFELDAARGIAILAMIIYHFFYDLSFLGIASRDMYAGGWSIFQKCIAGLFLLIVGISLTISYTRAQQKHSMPQLIRKYVKRGLIVFGFGLLISVVTYVLFPQTFIVFGILHMIGVSIILALFFMQFYYLNFFLGLIIIFLGTLTKATMTHNGFLWLGFVTPSFASLDYYPLLPWFGVVLIGLFIGKTLYPKGKQLFTVKEFIGSKTLTWIGQQSLVIYLFHQPLIIGFLLLILSF